MKKPLLILVAVGFMMMTLSCNLFKPKYGCPTNGKNVGAEKILSGDPKAMKDVKKAKKFRS